MNFHTNDTHNDDVLFTKLIKEIFTLDLSHQRYTIEQLAPLSKLLLNQLSQKGEIQPDEFLADHEMDREKVDLIIEKLVESNVLRYTQAGSLSWHGRPQKCTFASIGIICIYYYVIAILYGTSLEI